MVGQNQVAKTATAVGKNLWLISARVVNVFLEGNLILSEHHVSSFHCAILSTIFMLQIVFDFLFPYCHIKPFYLLLFRLHKLDAVLFS